MTPLAALTLITYVWHYVVARLVYDQLLRPALHGHVIVPALICGVTLVAFLAGRWTGRRRI
jgi:hypothetical protein